MVGPESSSDATLATGGDNGAGSNSYNLRRGPISSRFQSNEALFRTYNQSRKNETCVDWSIDWNSEFPGLVLSFTEVSMNCCVLQRLSDLVNLQLLF